eukprot:3289702-Prymnesium_polylepis.1
MSALPGASIPYSPCMSPPDPKITVGAQRGAAKKASKVLSSAARKSRLLRAKQRTGPRCKSAAGPAILTPPPRRRPAYRAPHPPRHAPLAPSTRPRARCGRAGSPLPRRSSPSPGRTRPRGADARA